MLSQPGGYPRRSFAAASAGREKCRPPAPDWPHAGQGPGSAAAAPELAGGVFVTTAPERQTKTGHNDYSY